MNVPQPNFLRYALDRRKSLKDYDAPAAPLVRPGRLVGESLSEKPGNYCASAPNRALRLADSLPGGNTDDTFRSAGGGDCIFHTFWGGIFRVSTREARKPAS